MYKEIRLNLDCKLYVLGFGSGQSFVQTDEAYLYTILIPRAKQIMSVRGFSHVEKPYIALITP